MDSTALGTLRNKFLKEAKELEDQLQERRDKIKAIDLVLGMLIEQAGDKRGSDSPLGGDVNRFRKMGAKEAIFKCMNEPIRWWSMAEVKKTLFDGGFKSKSKDPGGVISSTLIRLVKEEEIQSDKTAKPQRFKVKEKQTSAVELPLESKPEA